MNDDAHASSRVDETLENGTATINQSPQNEVVTIKQCADDETVMIDQSSKGRTRKPRAKETRRRREKGLGGLQLEKTGIWTLRCSINGKRVSKSTGTRDRAEAELFAKRFLAPYVKDDPARTLVIVESVKLAAKRGESLWKK